MPENNLPDWAAQAQQLQTLIAETQKVLHDQQGQVAHMQQSLQLLLTKSFQAQPGVMNPTPPNAGLGRAKPAAPVIPLDLGLDPDIKAAADQGASLVVLLLAQIARRLRPPAAPADPPPPA